MINDNMGRGHQVPRKGSEIFASASKTYVFDQLRKQVQNGEFDFRKVNNPKSIFDVGYHSFNFFKYYQR